MNKLRVTFIWGADNGFFYCRYPLCTFGDLFLHFYFTENKQLNDKVVKPDSANVFDRKDGVVYFFHSNEGNHLNSPHVHARYGGHEMKIDLTSFTCIGDLGNGKKTRLAIDYVKEKQSGFLSEWHKIIG